MIGNILTFTPRLAFKTLIIAAALCLITPLSSYAERSITFYVAHNLSEDVAGSKDKTPDITTGELRPGHYSNSRVMALLEPSVIGDLCFYGNSIIESMDIEGNGAQIIYGNVAEGATKRPYFFLSPNFVDPDGSIVNNGPAKFTFHLIGQNTGWNISAIGIDGLNFDAYRYNNRGGTGASGIIKVNGHEIRWPWNRFQYSRRIDLDDNEKIVRDIVIEAEEGAAVGFRGITIYLDETPDYEGVELDEICFEKNTSGQYRIPIRPVGLIDDANLIGCSIFDYNDKQMEISSWQDASGYFILRDFGIPESDSFDEGVYRAVFYVKDGAYSKTPQAHDGARFAIRPIIGDFTLNGAGIINGHCIIPSSYTANSATTTPGKVMIEGLLPEAAIYYKTSEASSETEADGLMPWDTSILDGFIAATDNILDISHGSRLSVIESKNGALSRPVTITYELENQDNSVDELTDLDNAEEYYCDLLGRKVTKTTANGVVIRIRKMRDGRISSHKEILVP